MSRSKDAMPPGRCFQIAADLWFALNPGEKRFSGGSKIARTIYPHIEAAYRLGLETGIWCDEQDKRRILRNVGKKARP